MSAAGLRRAPPGPFYRILWARCRGVFRRLELRSRRRWLPPVEWVLPIYLMHRWEQEIVRRGERLTPCPRHEKPVPGFMPNYDPCLCAGGSLAS